MKTQILDQYEPPKDWMIRGIVALDSHGYAIYRSDLSGNKFVIDIFGSVERTIDVSEMVRDRQIKHHRLFSFAEGLALCDWNNSKILLWPDAAGDPLIVRVEQASESELDMRGRCLAFASYDPASRTILLGLNDNAGPAEIARYWAVLEFAPNEMVESGRNEMTMRWNEIRELDVNHYPSTGLGHAPKLEWLSINDIVKTDRNIYLYTVGGSRTRMRSGSEYEFSILSAYGDDSEAPTNLQVSEGIWRFSSDKRFFIVKPKRRKCLLAYDLTEMALTYEVPLRLKQNTQGIDPGHGVRADLREDRLYIHSLFHLNVCQLLH